MSCSCYVLFLSCPVPFLPCHNNNNNNNNKMAANDSQSRRCCSCMKNGHCVKCQCVKNGVDCWPSFSNPIRCEKMGQLFNMVPNLEGNQPPPIVTATVFHSDDCSRGSTLNDFHIPGSFHADEPGSKNSEILQLATYMYLAK